MSAICNTLCNTLCSVVTHDYTKQALAGVIVLAALAAIGGTAYALYYTGSQVFVVTSFNAALATKLSALWANVVTALAAGALALGLLSLAAKVRPQPSAPTASGNASGSTATGT